jgi:hypothetical protein
MNNTTVLSWLSTLIMFLLFSLFAENAYSQADDYEGRKVSITLSTGFTYASAGDGQLGRLAGNFNVPSFRQPVYGGSFQYAFSPSWSFETAMHFGSFKNQFDSDPFFETDFVHVTLKGVTNINNLLNLRWGPSRVFNPYLSFGVGMIRSDFQTDDLDSQDIALLVTGGAGMSFYLFRGADLFVQYDFNAVASDLVDGFSGDGGSDQFAALSGGLRLNFGSRDKKHVSWPPPREPRVRERREVQQPLPVPEPEPEPEILVRETEPVIQREETFRVRESSIRVSPEFLKSMLAKGIVKAYELREEIRQEAAEIRRQERIQAEEERRAALLRRQAHMAEQVSVQAPEAGHYVQVSSFLSRATANSTRANLVEQLSGQISNASGRVIIHQYEQYNRVLIGPFTRVGEARSILEEIANTYENAFLITFPRRQQD